MKSLIILCVFQRIDIWWFDYFVAWKFESTYNVKLFKTPNDSSSSNHSCQVTWEENDKCHLLFRDYQCVKWISWTTKKRGSLHRFSIILEKARAKKIRWSNKSWDHVYSLMQKQSDCFPERVKKTICKPAVFYLSGECINLSAFPQVWETSRF